MAQGCCSGRGTCSCVIRSDSPNLIITGAGTDTSPMVFDITGLDWIDSFTVNDTPTVNLTVTGGTGGDPLVLRADATIAVEALTNLDSSTGTVGDVIKYLGAGQWEVGPPPIAPAGAVNTSDGILGDGSAPNPIEVAVSGVWGVAPLNVYGGDSTVGLAVYIDSAGEVRAEPRPGDWTTLTNKPAVFPTNAANVADPLNLNVGFIRGKRFFTDPTDTTGANAPSVGVNDGDMYFFVKAP